tara:strand:+ start:128 stop:328 length:201 start_codon:yes stop_codon:yes gene_type:complete
MIDERERMRYLKVGKGEDLVYPCSGEFNKERIVAILSEEDIKFKEYIEEYIEEWSMEVGRDFLRPC